MTKQEPQNQMEREFVAIIEEGKQKLFDGPGAAIPISERRTILAGVKIQRPETGEVICTLADDDYLTRFRRATAKRQPDIKQAQDAYAALVEQCRLKQVNRIIMQIKRGREATRYERHDPQVDLSDVPVFYFRGQTLVDPDSGENTGLEVHDPEAAEEALTSGSFKLPFPRCAFLQRIDTDAPNLVATTLLKTGGRWGKHTGRYWVTVTEEEGDGSILLFGFVKHDDHERWNKQVWQANLRPDGEIVVAAEPGGASPDFVKILIESVQGRVYALVNFIYRIVTTKRGSTSFADGGAPTSKIDARRTKLSLPTIPRIRVLKFDPPPTQQAGVSRGKGTPKSAHWRIGHWRALATGRRIWIDPMPIKGGGGPPPWYVT